MVDCASTADALRMLTLPATFGLYLERAWPRHRRLSTGADDARTAAMHRSCSNAFSAGTEQLGSLLTGGERVSAPGDDSQSEWSPQRRSAPWARWR